MDPRSANILRAVVRHFIETGQPVSSEQLFRAHDFGIRPAMIRLELNELTEHGYLEQPHHASGRVPSDRGYEFYVSEVIAEPEQQVNHHWLELFERGAWPELVSGLSEELGVVGAAMAERHGLIFKGFLENLVDHLEWHSRPEIKSIIRDFEELEERLAAAKRLMENEDFLKVMVGRSPIAKSGQLSVMLADYDVGGERLFLCAVGPKRMDYEKSANILKGLKRKSKTKNERRKSKSE